MLVRVLLVLAGIVVALAASDDPSKPKGENRPVSPEPIKAQGIDNLFRLSPRLYSGAQPEGDAGFASLKRLGVRTIISVDGSTPDVEAARRQGLRYVHLPIGYDGVPREQAVRLIKAMNQLPGPIMVHCHHGKHRGPSAAAVCALATEGWNREQARAWLECAGTDPNYQGLFESVDRFQAPSSDDLDRVGPNDLPERAEVPDLVDAMVQVDATWDRLKAIQKAGFRTPPENPDLSPSHEALMLAERFREAQRQDDVKARGEAFVRLLADSETSATALQASLKRFETDTTPTARRDVEQTFMRVGRSCSTCHDRYRDHLDREGPGGRRARSSTTSAGIR